MGKKSQKRYKIVPQIKVYPFSMHLGIYFSHTKRMGKGRGTRKKKIVIF